MYRERESNLPTRTPASVIWPAAHRMPWTPKGPLRIASLRQATSRRPSTSAPASYQSIVAALHLPSLHPLSNRAHLQRCDQRCALCVGLERNATSLSKLLWLSCASYACRLPQPRVQWASSRTRDIERLDFMDVAHTRHDAAGQMKSSCSPWSDLAGAPWPWADGRGGHWVDQLTRRIGSTGKI